MLKYFILTTILIDFIVSYGINPISDETWVQAYNPHWDATNERLLMADYMNGTLLNYVPSINQVFMAVIPGVPSPSYIIPLKCNSSQFLVSNHLTSTVIEWDGRSATARVLRNAFSVETKPNYAKNNWNIGKASPQCHFYGGTYRGNICGTTCEYPNGALYSYNKCDGAKAIIRDIKASSGMDWNAEGTKFYHVDSCKRIIREFDYDSRTGKISNGRVVFQYQGDHGEPDSVPLGMTIDKDGFLYLCIYYGGVVLKIDPKTGRVVLVIDMQTLIVASAAWGGKNLDILYVTTASKAFDTNTGQLTNRTFSAQGGKVYAITGLGTTGIPGRAVCI